MRGMIKFVDETWRLQLHPSLHEFGRWAHWYEFASLQSLKCNSNPCSKRTNILLNPLTNGGLTCITVEVSASTSLASLRWWEHRAIGRRHSSTEPSGTGLMVLHRFTHVKMRADEYFRRPLLTQCCQWLSEAPKQLGFLKLFQKVFQKWQ